MAGDKTASCLSCGFQNVRGDQFCGSCGVYLAWDDDVHAPDRLDADGATISAEMPAPASAQSGTPPDPVTPGVAEAVAAGSIVCDACSLVNVATRTFCQRCGDRLDRGRLATQPPTPAPASPAARRAPATASAPAGSDPGIPPGSASRTAAGRLPPVRVLALLAVVAVVAVGAAAMFLLQPAPSVNLALGRPVTAPASQPDAPPAAAVDGTWDTDLVWNAGDLPPQWIEVDLGDPATITGLRLVVAQYPSGQTLHRVTGRANDDGPEVSLHVFEEPTADAGVLAVTLDPPVPGIRFVRIETVASPSYVAWREIEVLGRR
jgi:hypothetical protein